MLRHFGDQSSGSKTFVSVNRRSICVRHQSYLLVTIKSVIIIFSIRSYIDPECYVISGLYNN